MPVDIVNFPFQSQSDKCLVLSNGQWAATGLGSSWRWIFIGIRYCVEDIGTNLNSGTGFFVGVMSNPTTDSNGNLNNGFLSATPGHMAGLYNYYTSGTIARYADATRVSYSQTGRGIVRVGANSTLGSSFVATPMMGSIPFGTKRFALILSLVKSQVASTYTLSIYAAFPISSTNPSAWPPGNLTLQQFVNAMLTGSYTSARDLLNTYEGSSTYGSANYQTVPVDEGTNGPLNSIHITWGRSSPRLAISDVCYVIKE
jgi:hypothetical protein